MKTINPNDVAAKFQDIRNRAAVRKNALALTALDVLASGLSTLFTESNPSFHRVEFLKNCGVSWFDNQES